MNQGNLNYETDNILYAPGLSTYSIKGKQGETGQRGTSLFYAQYDLEIPDNKSMIEKKISDGLSLYSNEEFEYQENDLIIDSIANLYIINEDKLIEKLGNIRSYPKIGFTIGTGNTLVVKSEYQGLYEYDFMDSSCNVTAMNVAEGSSIGTTSYIRIRDKESGEMSIINIK